MDNLLVRVQWEGPGLYCIMDEWDGVSVVPQRVVYAFISRYEVTEPFGLAWLCGNTQYFGSLDAVRAKYPRYRFLVEDTTR